MDIETFRILTDRYKGQIVDNKYEVLSGLGFGTYGAVFLGYEHLKKRHVALKRVVVNRGDLTALTSEMDGMEVLSGSPNVIQYLGYAIEEPSTETVQADPAMAGSIYFYIVMEFGGTSLEAYLRRYGAEAYREDKDEAFWRRNEMLSIHMIKEALGGLIDSHERRIVHRDIKPANIYVGVNGTVRLGDFGVAKQLIQEGAEQGTIVGTAFYMAPEQVMGEAYGLNVDIFAMGVVLYRLLTGRMPFANLMQIRAQAPDLAASGIFPGMEEILGRALCKDPGERYASAQDFLFDLEDYEVGLEPVGFGELLQQFKTRINDLLDADVKMHLAQPPTGEGTFAQTMPPSSTTAGTGAAVPPADDMATRIGSLPTDGLPSTTSHTGEDFSDDATRIFQQTTKPVEKKEPQPPTPPPPPAPPQSQVETPVPEPPTEETPYAEETMGDTPTPPEVSGGGLKMPLVLGIVTIVLVLAGVVVWMLWPSKTSLRIFCDQGATVFLNDVQVGTIPPTGPFEIKVEKDLEHKVRLTFDGYEDASAVLAPGRSILDMKMTPEAKPPVLALSLNLRDVVLRVGDRTVTDAPVMEEGRYIWRLTDLAPGNYAVEASLPGSNFLPATGTADLKEGQLTELSLDLSARAEAQLSVKALDPKGSEVKGFTLKVDGAVVVPDADNKIPGTFSLGDSVELSVEAPGFVPWSQRIELDKEAYLATANLTPKKPNVAEVAKAVPPGFTRVTAKRKSIVFVNWEECGTTPAVCRIPEGKAAEVFVVNYRTKRAWLGKYPAGGVPKELYAPLKSCKRNVILDWKPWAYVKMQNHKGRKVPLTVSALEEMPQTPKRVTDVSCGAYKVTFSDAEKTLAVKWIWVKPSDPPTVRVGKFK